MSTLEEDFVSALTSTFNGRLYASIAPARVASPYAIYSQVSGAPETVFAGMTNLTNARMQLDIFSTSKSDVKTLALAAKAVIDSASSFKGINENEMDLFEDAKLLYQVMLDFSIWRYD